jgi:hypothetical protein
MSDFLEYLWKLFCTAFNNPDSKFFTIFGYCTAGWAIIMFFIPKWGRKMNKPIIKWINKYRYLILSLLILLSLILSAYTIQVNTVNPLDRPILSLSPDTSNWVLSSDDKQAILAINLNNTGKLPAYQFNVKLYFAPASSPQHYTVDETGGVNPIFPNVSSAPIGLNIIKGDDDLWLLRIRFSYSNAEVKGTIYEDNWWYVYSFSKHTLTDMTESQKNAYIKAIGE